MGLFLTALFIFLISGIVSRAIQHIPKKATDIGAYGAVGACILGLISALRVLLSGETIALSLPWAIPFGSFSLAIDPLSAFFLVPVFIVCALAAVYGSGYCAVWHGKKPVGTLWLFFNLLIASMAMLISARNGMLFLIVWEIMSIVSFFLVAFEDEKESVRTAAYIYLVAAHIGAAFLFVMFIILGKAGDSFDFNTFGGYGATTASVLFFLALAGFGTKAGFMPLHVWLPEAHPAAPTHVSAVMSAVMIKTGIYGIVRILTFLGPPPPMWGGVLLGIGLFSGLLGILFALAQHDLKRVLAYSSVENIGIIGIGLGIGVLGIAAHSPLTVLLGFVGALLHVINHSFFKGLLFFGAGSIYHGTGTRMVDYLGGLLKRMPGSGRAFLVGAIAICGVPPLNGFIGEFLMYCGAVSLLLTGSVMIVPAVSVFFGLSLIGGLAIACFSKVYGISFLGEPRSQAASQAHESGPRMLVPMYICAAGCVIMMFVSPFIIRIFPSIVSTFAYTPYEHLTAAARDISARLSGVVFVSLGFIVCVAILWAIRSLVFAGKTVKTAVTWDCGYAQPTARMQYTGSSFVQPLTHIFRFFLRPHYFRTVPKELFPKDTYFATETPDVFQRVVYRPFFEKVSRSFFRLHWFQHGRLQAYILYIFVTLLILLMWKLR